jgi:hypothetical protein
MYSYNFFSVNHKDESVWEEVEDGLRVRRVGVSNLRITKVRGSDGGRYRCVASAPGLSNSTAEVTLNIYCKYMYKNPFLPM